MPDAMVKQKKPYRYSGEHVRVGPYMSYAYVRNKIGLCRKLDTLNAPQAMIKK